MMRHCDGTDPTLVRMTGGTGKPCRCGLTFDDCDQRVTWPHPLRPREQKAGLRSAELSWLTETELRRN